MNNFILAFIPIFVAVDALGVLPIFVSLTQGLKKREKTKIILSSATTATILAVAFIFLGKFIFKVLGITVGDFMIAGGFVLFCIAIRDILNPGKQRRVSAKELGAVPLGIPLIVGPAVLTTSLIIIAEYGMIPTLVSVVVNVVLAGVIFSSSNILIKALGENGTRALSKVMSLLLAAIAIMMVRKGIISVIVLSLPPLI
jgi:multiple antibiotic resistance protein